MRLFVLAILMAAMLPAAAQPANPPAQAAPAGQTASETVKVTAPPMPDAVINSFVKTYTAPSLLTGKIPRWAKGICLQTQGLPSELEEAVTNRILEVAREVGAPVQNQPCTLNVAILFDRDPQSVMDDIAAHHEELLGPHSRAQVKDLATVRHQIQAWYATGTRDNKGVWQVDTPETTMDCDGIDRMTIGGVIGGTGGMKTDANKYANALDDMLRYCNRKSTTGQRLRDGLQSEFAAVTVVAAIDALNYHQLGAITDYIALLTLSQTEAFDTCQKMQSIANLLVPGCDVENKIDGLTDGDMAFLKALYHADSGGTLVAQQAAIADEMKKSLPAR